jgi:hypothetical protein
MYQAVSFVNQSAKWHRDKCKYSFFMCVVFTLCVVLQLYQLVKMTDVKEQRICIKFCFKLGKMAAETDEFYLL